MMSGYVLCGHCGAYHQGPCPKIKAIEYHPDGTIKRVEYRDDPLWLSGSSHVTPPVKPSGGEHG